MALALAVTLASLLLAVAPDQPKKGAKGLEGYTWEKDFEQAKLKAAAEGKLFYVDFYTDW